MQVLLAYDQWCYAKIEGLLVWLEEWFSISQKTIEQAIITLYVFLVIISCSRTDITLGCLLGLFSGSSMWVLHLRSVESRYASQKSPLGAMFRAFLQGWVVWLDFLILGVSPHHWQDIPNALAQILFLIFFYMIDICSWGQKGRRRKLALAELKKMFGVIWVPKPIPISE